MAEMLEIPQPSISRIINGKQYPDFDLAIKASDLLGIGLDWLAYGREQVGTNKKPYYTNPERQRIEYLMSLLSGLIITIPPGEAEVKRF
ncbi:MAG: helix-turn-helix domain-containing protein [Treponema sp.]|jgi:plasmid maintenance system antidote protein VapI|nr:helix-turn-helix domain-containing protein [Treponema sp.]